MNGNWPLAGRFGGAIREVSFEDLPRNDAKA
jgi:hypothetical protein